MRSLERGGVLYNMHEKNTPRRALAIGFRALYRTSAGRHFDYE